MHVSKNSWNNVATLAVVNYFYNCFSYLSKAFGVCCGEGQIMSSELTKDNHALAGEMGRHPIQIFLSSQSMF